MIMLIWSFWTFLNTLPIIENGRKAYRNWCFQSCWIASVATIECLVGRLCIVAFSGKVWKQTGPTMVSLNDFPGSFGMPSLLSNYSDWVYILLSKVFSSLWDNPKFLLKFWLNICSGFVPWLINKRKLSYCLSVDESNLDFWILLKKYRTFMCQAFSTEDHQTPRGYPLTRSTPTFLPCIRKYS